MRDKRFLFAVALALAVAMRWAAAIAAETAGDVRAKAVAVLRSNAPVEQKLAAFEDLARVGDKECVPVLAGMLGDEKLSHMARYALEPIPDKSVDEVLRAAAAKLNGKLLSGVISSIGARRDSAAVELLEKHLGSSDGDVVRTTAIALGRIGTVAAGKALLTALQGAKEDNAVRICDGLLTCAANLAAQGRQGEAKRIYDGMLAQNLPVRIRAAALRGAVLCDPSDGMKQLGGMIHGNDFCAFAMGLRVAAEVKDRKVTEVLVSGIGKLPADRVVAVVKILGQRGDKAAVPLLLTMAKSGEKDVRLEAVQSLAEIGDTSAMPILVELMKDKDEQIGRAAAAAMVGLPGPEVDSAIVKILESRDPALKLKMIETARLRRAGSAMPALLKSMSDADISIRTAAARSYGELAGEEGIPVLIDMLLKSTDGGEIGLYERALASVCPMASDKDACTGKLVDALSKAGPAVKPALLRTLRVAGGPDALKAVRTAVDDANKEVHTAAVRVLTEWTSTDAAPILLELAKTSTDATDKTLALRGYLGIALQGNVAPQHKLAICRQAAPLVQREEEKRMLLGAVAGASTAELLDLTVPYLDDASVRREAVATVMAIAEKRKKNQHAGVAKAVLEKVVKAAADDPAVVKRAEALLRQMADEK
jgi:HEAT repeat protein